MKPDKELVRRRFGQKLAQYHNLASVQQGIAAELAKLYGIHFHGFEAKKVYEAGAGTGFLTRFLNQIHPDAHFFLNDITDMAGPYLSAITASVRTTFIWGDAENTEMPAGLDTVASASTVQWFADLSAFLARAAEATVKGGALVLSTFGPDNFREVRTLIGYGLDYHTRAELGRMVEQAGYEVLHLSEQTRTLYFDIPVDVVYHIRTTGVNAIKPVRWDRSKLREFNERYRSLFMTRDGLIPLTYHPVFLVAKKK